MDDGVGEEARRVNDRFFAGVLLFLFTGICQRAADLDVSDPNPGPTTTKNAHVAFYCASELNKLANLCFIMVIIRIALVILGIAFVPVGLRRLREESDMKLAMGSFCLLTSLFFLAYLNWFVVIDA